ncbi:MAG TPA: cytochrome c peroxidase, partial [Nitrosomonas sp.]|nr:cytochrome c peroxidase [Nitrosomonas sp.]
MVPEPDNLAEFIIDKRRAIELGKALFWEMRVGSDGITACGTCHFNAGADSRSKNQINPGSNQITLTGSPDPDLIFDFPPNHQLTKSNFPFRKLSNPLDRNSYPDFDSNDIVSSQGVSAAQFLYVKKGKVRDIVSPKLDQDGFLIDNE